MAVLRKNLALVRSLTGPRDRPSRLTFRYASFRYASLPEKDPAAVKLGRKGGKKIAKRGSEYFSQLQAKRKNRKGGLC